MLLNQNNLIFKLNLTSKQAKPSDISLRWRRKTKMCNLDLIQVSPFLLREGVEAGGEGSNVQVYNLYKYKLVIFVWMSGHNSRTPLPICLKC